MGRFTQHGKFKIFSRYSLQHSAPLRILITQTFIAIFLFRYLSTRRRYSRSYTEQYSYNFNSSLRMKSGTSSQSASVKKTCKCGRVVAFDDVIGNQTPASSTTPGVVVPPIDLPPAMRDRHESFSYQESSLNTDKIEPVLPFPLVEHFSHLAAERQVVFMILSPLLLLWYWSIK